MSLTEELRYWLRANEADWDDKMTAIVSTIRQAKMDIEFTLPSTKGQCNDRFSCTKNYTARIAGKKRSVR